MAAHAPDSDALEEGLRGLPATHRLGLDQTMTRTVLKECAAEISALSDALGN
jgi:hypothetical protein